MEQVKMRSSALTNQAERIGGRPATHGNQD
jgi:hypothetical protein